MIEKANKILFSNATGFLFIYLLTLSIVLGYVLQNLEVLIYSDRLFEYACYLYTIETGTLQMSADSLVNSSIMVNYIPALIQRATNIDPILLFKIFPQFFFAMTPAFIYLIGRLYFSRRYALLGALFMLTNFYILFYPEIGRVGVGFSMMAGAVWAILDRRILWASIFVILVVFAHYGTTFLLASLLLFTFVILFSMRRTCEWKRLLIPLVILVAVGSIWHIGIVQSSWNVSYWAVKQTIDITSDVSGWGDKPKQIPKEVVSEETDESAYNRLWDLKKRESVVQVAFGRTLPYMNIPQKIEFALAWLVILTLAGGTIYSLHKRTLTLTHAIMAIGVTIMFALALFFPAASKLYGIYRFYTTAIIVLTPCWVLLAKKTKYYYALGLLMVYALCISGILYSWFGIVK